MFSLSHVSPIGTQIFCGHTIKSTNEFVIKCLNELATNGMVLISPPISFKLKSIVGLSTKAIFIPSNDGHHGTNGVNTNLTTPNASMCSNLIGKLIPAAFTSKTTSGFTATHLNSKSNVTSPSTSSNTFAAVKIGGSSPNVHVRNPIFSLLIFAKSFTTSDNAQITDEAIALSRNGHIVFTALFSQGTRW